MLNQVFNACIDRNDKSKCKKRKCYPQCSLKIYKSMNISNFKKIVKIGEGQLSKVYVAQEINTNIMYVVKSFTKNNFHVFLNQVNISRQISHPYIQNIIGYSPIDFEHNNNPTIFTKYCKNGSLKDFLEHERKSGTVSVLNDKLKYSLTYKIASALSYLHSINIVHRDIKPDNILIDEKFMPIICDFGCAKFTTELNDNFIGSPLYLAPENWKGKEYSAESDVYAFGLIMYEILIGPLPFAKLDSSQIYYQVAVKNEKPAINDKIHSVYRELINSCLSSNLSERLSFDEIVQQLRNNEDVLSNNSTDNIYAYCKDTSNKFQGAIILDNTCNETELLKENINQLNIKEIDLNRYEKICKIGSGGFGEVYLIRHKWSRKLFAAKKFLSAKNKMLDFLHELKINSEIKHPSITKLIGYSLRDFSNDPSMIIITEYVVNSSLERILQYERNSVNQKILNETMKLITIYRIASAILYLHSIGILHLDIKPDNVLMDGFLLSKICDFGNSLKIANDQIMKPEMVGTYSFMSPEILKCEKPTTKSDVYSFGMLLYEIKSNTYPFEGHSIHKILYNALNGIRPKMNKSIPKVYQELIKACWDDDPNKRPSFEDILIDLRYNKEFITQDVDESLYLSFIDIFEDEKKGIDISSKRDKLFQKFNIHDFFKNIAHHDESSSSNTSYSYHSSTNKISQFLSFKELCNDYNNKTISCSFLKRKMQNQNNDFMKTNNYTT